MLNNLKLSFILTTLKCTNRTLKVRSQVLIKGKTSLFDASEMLIATDNISVFQENNRNYVRTVQKMWSVCVRRKLCISQRISVSHIGLFWIHSRHKIMLKLTHIRFPNEFL